MSRRIEIELTSRRDDGTWTWRAAGAREPRGSVEAELLPPQASVGDVFRAEADFEIDGIFVTSVQPPREIREGDAGSNRIEVLGSGRDSSGGVSVTMTSGRRHRDDASGARERGARPSAPGRPMERAARQERPRGAQRDRSRPEGAGRSRPDRDGRRTERRGRSEETPDTRAGSRTEAQELQRPRGRAARSKDAPADRRERRRVEPVTTHRNASLAELRPEQLPVAEQLLRGGIPALRRAIDEQNTRARAEGRAEVPPEPLLAMAEELLPVINLAAWKDRAVAVRTAGRDAPLREVRSVVSGASAVNLDEEARTLLSSLRESLESRVTALREAWLGRINNSLKAGRVADALRTSARPPEPGARLPGELAVRLAEAASASMSPDLAQEGWAELLEAVIDSPVRRNVKPVGLPAEVSEDLMHAARRAAGYVPGLARLLGLPIPPPPGPRRPAVSAARRA
jgi:hypothetical protein